MRSVIGTSRVLPSAATIVAAVSKLLRPLGAAGCCVALLSSEVRGVNKRSTF